MPLGTRHIIRGRLRLRDRVFWLDVDEGGRWMLNITDVRARRLVDAAVVVDATRWGFDLLDVHRIWRQDSPEPASLRQRLAACLRRRSGGRNR